MALKIPASNEGEGIYVLTGNHGESVDSIVDIAIV
jgi:hypothetical protein